ncbi:GIY-YIG nuclease family protein [Phyllobacterium sp. P5_D12]
MISTGCGAEERPQAELALSEYINNGVAEVQYFIYFVSAAAPGFPVKIGISQDRVARFFQLQNALPYDVDVLAIMPTKDPLLERRLHKRFKHLRLRGEWFERSQELLDYIQLLQDSDEAA